MLKEHETNGIITMDDNNKNGSSSDDDSGTDEQDETSDRFREKRGIPWCGVDTEAHSTSYYQRSRPLVTWPPDPSSAGTSSWRNLRNVRPLFGAKMQLYSRTNYNLAVYADGAVRGTMDDSDLHTHLELSSAGFPGHVRIQGLLTKLYIAMDSKGRLYGEPDVTEEGTVFIESLQGSYNTYLSRKYAHLGWYLGIKKSGKCKKGPKTAYGQKAIKFLPRRSKFQ